MISKAVKLVRPGIHGPADVVTDTATGDFLGRYR